MEKICKVSTGIADRVGRGEGGRPWKKYAKLVLASQIGWVGGRGEGHGKNRKS